MKNLKKVLALVVALTMVLGTVAFAFTDVAEDAGIYTAVQTLSSLDILNGYGDGTFGPEKDITRAEFAAVVCRALGLESSANGAKGAGQFTDVPADHWASGYINLAAGQGIVNGMGDGTFAPSANVTYEQAIKMLVVALGFEPMAAQKGGWPTGYLVVANTYGMTKGVNAPADSAPANRGIVAQLTYNALDIPMMAQTGFGTNVEYKIQDGTNDTTYTTLLTGLKVAKLEGAVTETAVIGGSVAVDEVEFDIAEANDNEYWEEYIYLNGTKATLTVAEGVNAADYFGYSSIVYAKEIKTGKWEIIAVMPGDDSAVVELSKGDIDTLTATELKYYLNDAATKTTNIKLDSLVDGQDIVINNVKADLADIDSLGDDAIITVIENTGDSKYDMIIAKQYNMGVIKTVDADRDRFELENATASKYNARFTFDFEDEDVSNVIINKDGEAITLADFAEGDVIAFITEGEAKMDFAWCEIINLGQNVVTGTITESNGTDSVYVDGVEYEVAQVYNGALYDGTQISVNDEGMYYLSGTGKIFAGEIDSSVASNYAYILEMGLSTSAFSNGWQFKLLTKEGEIKIFDVKDTFSINGTSTAKDAAYSTLATNGLDNLMTASDANVAFNQNVGDRLITYKLDGNNKIREIKTVAATAVGTPGNGVEYNANAVSIGNLPLNDDVVIFNVTGNDIDDSFVTTIESLVHETEYVGYVVQNLDLEYDAFVITEGLGAIDLTQDISIIDSVNKITLDDDDAWKIRYYTANEAELKELTITTETNPEYAGASSIEDVAASLAQGTVFMFTEDGNGVATNFAVIAWANNSTSASDAAYAVNSAATTAINIDEDLDFVASYIVDTKSTSKGTNIEIAGGNFVTLKGDYNAYTYYNRTASKVSVVAGDMYGANTVDVANTDAGTATYFIAIVENGVVSDIVTYSTQRVYNAY